MQKATRTRVRKAVDTEFGIGTFDEVLAGKKVLTVDGEIYTVEELRENKNIYISSNSDMEVETVKKAPEPAKPVSVIKTLEQAVGANKLADVMAGRAVLAINGQQVVVKNLTDASLYNNLSDRDRILVVRAAAGG